MRVRNSVFMLQLFSSDTLFGRHRSPGAIGSLWGGVESSSGHVPTVGASVAEACEIAREKCVLPISRKRVSFGNCSILFFGASVAAPRENARKSISRKEFPLDSMLSLFS
ncbi:hypothetical protein CEXT_390201 [Caerostris extrusa]|uniref:Secreted protein n=1 Tax=Caerostris extrusa TaxID=172846 RepID=A0AAV4NMT3_CAEEX|nr:hypothetical protein CEXT_390201 [Caerostris extrusa]